MRRVSTGEGGDHDIIYENSDMSLSMKILKARLCQVLIESRQFDLRTSKSFFVYFFKSGGDSGYEFTIPCENHGYKIFKIHEKIREYYKGNIEIYLDQDRDVFGNQGFSYKVLDKSSPVCTQCKGKKFIREDGFGYIESCSLCNSNFQLPFSFH